MKRITASVTQGGADAFAEAEFSTGLSNVTGQCFRIRRLEWLMPALASADSDASMTLSTKSQSSILFGSNACLAGISRKVELTTSGSPVYELFPNGVNYERDMDLLIVEESLFLEIDSTSTGAANQGAVVIWYEQRSISQVERLGIQASRLA